MTTDSPYLNLLKNRVNLSRIPFSERGSRLLVFHADDQLAVRLAERWFKREGQLSGYRQRPPLIDELRFTDGEGRPLEMKLTTYPHRVDCETDIGTFTLTRVPLPQHTATSQIVVRSFLQVYSTGVEYPHGENLR